jgi:hypothetical protein
MTHLRYQLLLCAWGICLSLLVVSGADAQTIISSPPTVIPFGGTYAVPSGTTLNVYDGEEIHASLGIHNGGVLNLFGGELTQPVGAGSGSIVNIYSGNIAGGISGGFIMSSASQTTMAGGWFTHTLLKQTTATLIMEGVDFAFDSIPIPGLAQSGDEVVLPVPENAFLTGVFANGSPFTFHNDSASGDRFYGNITFRQSARPTGSPVVNVPTEPIPPGVLPGQTLIVLDGAILPNGLNGAPGSTLDVRGGQVGLFEAYKSNVRISGGIARSVTAYTGSSVHISGGQTFRVTAREGVRVDVEAGQVGSLVAYSGSDISIEGGSIDRLQVLSGGMANLHGGQIVTELSLGSQPFHMTGGVIPQSLIVPVGAHFLIAGGALGASGQAVFDARTGSEITLFGRQFLLGGQPVAGLSSPGDSIILANRPDLNLDVILADGSPLVTYVGTIIMNPGPLRSRIAAGATLRLTLVPEPGTLAVAPIAILVLHRQRRSSVSP